MTPAQSVAHLDLSFEEHVAVLALLRMNEAVVDARPELQRVRKGLLQLQFNIRPCASCGVDFEAQNPRKTTCSDRCRQRLSRSGRRHAPAVTFSAPGLQLLFAVGDLVGLVGYEREQEPLGEITAFAGFLEEEFTNDHGEVIPAGPVYEVTRLDGTDICLPESKLIHWGWPGQGLRAETSPPGHNSLPAASDH